MRAFIVNNTAASVLRDASSDLFGTYRSLAVLLLVAFLAGLTGPFGTATSIDAWGRFLFWTFVVFGTVLPVHGVLALFERTDGRGKWRDIAWMTLACLVAAVPATLVVCTVTTAFGSRIDLIGVGELYSQIALVILVITAIVELVSGALRSVSKDAVEAPILQRLPGACRGKLIRLAAQDHYVEVVTDGGRALVAMRFRDAISEAAPVAGIQVHRSHWVATDAVIGRSTLNGTIRLRLADGSGCPLAEHSGTQPGAWAFWYRQPILALATKIHGVSCSQCAAPASKCSSHGQPGDSDDQVGRGTPVVGRGSANGRIVRGSFGNARQMQQSQLECSIKNVSARVC